MSSGVAVKDHTDIGEDVQITSQGIKNSLKKFSALQAIAELVWNGFDAGATNVVINISHNSLEAADTVVIQDNGRGIDNELLASKFKPFFQSEKIYDPEVKHSTTHGKNGVGRLTFFVCSNFATWHTVYSKDDKKFSYSIEVSSIELQRYKPTALDEISGDSITGTTVVLEDIISTDITEPLVRDYLALEFCWFLELNKDKGYFISINDDNLNYSEMVISEERQTYVHKTTKMLFDVRYICWNKKLSEYSKYYYVDSKGDELAKENTTLSST